MTSKTRTACLVILLLVSSTSIFAQHLAQRQLFLKNRVLSLSAGIPDEMGFNNRRLQEQENGKFLMIIQFDSIPGETVLSYLKSNGIEVLDYIPDYAYTTTVTARINREVLEKAGVRAIFRLGIEDILHPLLQPGFIPEHAKKVAGKADVTLSFARSFTFDEVIRDIQKSGFEVLSDKLKSYQLLEVRVSEDSLQHLAAFPWVQYLAPVQPPSEMLNDKSTASTKANVLGSTALLGYQLTGEGVVLGLGDDSNPLLHPDIGRRVINYDMLNNTWHGIHVGGIAAGSGLLNEKYKGYAPQSKIVFRRRSDIVFNAPEFVRDYGMVVTSNTYPGGSGCGTFGTYTYDSPILDQQAFELPHLQHIFAAGNSGMETNCQVSPAGYGTVLGTFQSAKNVLTVGMTQANLLINPTSSKGPVADGRIKPEITAPGSAIFSTIPGNTYQSASGTSMATPAVTGGAALLYQRYRQLNQGQNPKNALMKALITNGASDQGLPGPDYTYGFGLMNLLRSVTILDKGHFFSGTVTHAVTNTHQIVVPANTAKLKVLIYWNDPAPSVLAGGSALVNNLDLSVIRPDNTKMRPVFPSAADPTAAAKSGIDSLNNIEQIFVDAPAPGTYTVEVAATRIPQGVQEYFIVYDVIEPSLTLTYPLAGEHLTKGDALNICWESYGDATSTFKVSYSLNDGAAWTTLNANVAADQRQLPWTVPDAATGKAKVKIERNGSSNVSGAFAIIGVPSVTLQSAQCEGYIALQWNAVNGASDYEVMFSLGGEMKSAAITNALKYTLSGLSLDSVYYVSVRARKDQVPGRRSFAVIRKPDSGTCAGSISDNNLKLEAVLSPLPNARKFTYAAYLPEHSIQIRIKNLDDQPQAGPYEVGYSLGGAMHWETVNTPLAALASADYTFQKKADLASLHEGTLLVRLRLAGDPVQENDSLAIGLRQLPNPKVVLPYVHHAGSLPAMDVRETRMALQGAGEYDFIRVNGEGRLRTADSSKIWSSTQVAFILDKTRNDTEKVRSYLEGTYNLSDYHVQDDEVRLTFRHQYSYSYYHDFNRVYIRGGGNDPWILAYVRDAGTYGEFEDWFKLVSVDVTPLLRTNGQDFSAGFQVRWAAEAFNTYPEDGFIVDNIKLFKTTSDVELVRLHVPPVSPCESAAPASLDVVLRNNGSDNNVNVPVKMSVDGKVSEHTIDIIRKGDSTVVRLYYPTEIYTSGKHLVRVWSDKGSDINRANDTLEVELFTAATISIDNTHLENFELGNGGWFTEGDHSLWQFVTPEATGESVAGSGNNAWKTDPEGAGSNSESYLYSPCFNMNSYPLHLSFSAKIDMEDCDGNACDMLYLEYNSGYGWYRVGTNGDGTNWYNQQKDGLGHWSGKVATGWRVFTTTLPYQSNLRLRFVIKTNSNVAKRNIVIDDVHIYSMPYHIYDGSSSTFDMGPSYLSNGGWVPYFINDKIAMAIEPRGQNTERIGLNTYFNEGALQFSKDQLILDRNWVINTDADLDNPVGVRLYLPETTIERLVTDTAYPDLVKPASVYDLSLTKYAGPNQDGDLGNNANEGWDYFPADKVKKVPYRNGYYLEFETKTFSEFWLAKSYIGTGTPLPAELISFTAEKIHSGEHTAVQLKWATAEEKAFGHFVVQVAVGSENAKKGLFADLGIVKGKAMPGVQQYAFADDKSTLNNTHYYRLKMVDVDGSFEFSSVRAVIFNTSTAWRIFPNPSRDIFRLEPQGVVKGPVEIEVIDLSGKVRKQMKFREVTSALDIQLGTPDLPGGLYLLNVKSNEGEVRLRVMKE
ncbi:S8 family serine peptidase [Dyadobacter sp. Leaf189]|uniref:S8 family serine peptidase n=1 Tax=Dyadobacter sp. Leaf189 TaxID=1736295 RepID=UPI0007000E50|nr:S8 family serine peptidase [Dyadobacter sp. Leaf189]KQS26643.1 peptidase S8/S53 subtilisin kexin sedolisin [Dyadobacter sp. Leaf189]